ncbi:MAG: restriction endonuclease subunit S [Acidimicrobiaceae bacterium]|nr:restriction endonuclease subunit S [Acidimicrobiaceae bacterium]
MPVAATTRAPDATQTPDGWRLVRLGEVSAIRREQVKPRKGDSRPFVGLENMRSGGALNGHSTADESISNKTVFLEGDTLYGKLRPNLRKVVRADFDGVCSTDILAIHASERLTGSYLNHLVRSDILYKHAMRGVAGTRMPRTSWTHLRSFNLLLPPLAEQRAIAAALDSIDEAIKRADEVIAATERLRNALLHGLLARGLPGQHSEWKEVPGLGTIPASWKAVRLGKVCDVPRYGAGAPARPFDPTLPRYVRITDITDDGRLRRTDARSADPERVEGYALQAGDLLFARSGSVGRSYLYRPEDGPCVYAGYLIRFRARSNVAVPRFLSLWTRGQFYRRWVASMLRAGAQPNINATEYSSLPVALPPLSEQRAIVEVLDNVDASIERAREERDVLSTTARSVADALLTGRVRIPRRA